MTCWIPVAPFRAGAPGGAFSEYTSDRQFRRAVEREFEIIGEALARFARAAPDRAARISELPRIVGFRNRIIHGYDAIDHAAVWGVIEGHLPKLLVEAQAILAESEPS
ncbi:MAG: HepT-like ribonuclease domain-containing protein [Opitutaceae bacterium]